MLTIRELNEAAKRFQHGDKLFIVNDIDMSYYTGFKAGTIVTLESNNRGGVLINQLHVSIRFLLKNLGSNMVHLNSVPPAQKRALEVLYG